MSHGFVPSSLSKKAKTYAIKGFKPRRTGMLSKIIASLKKLRNEFKSKNTYTAQLKQQPRQGPSQGGICG